MTGDELTDFIDHFWENFDPENQVSKERIEVLISAINSLQSKIEEMERANRQQFDIGGMGKYPGLLKFVEEAGEALEIAGKIMADPSGNHWAERDDGRTPLKDRLEEEISDVSAAIMYLKTFSLDKVFIDIRTMEKYKKYLNWHNEERERRENP